MNEFWLMFCIVAASVNAGIYAANLNAGAAVLTFGLYLFWLAHEATR